MLGFSFSLLWRRVQRTLLGRDMVGGRRVDDGCGWKMEGRDTGVGWKMETGCQEARVLRAGSAVEALYLHPAPRAQLPRGHSLN